MGAFRVAGGGATLGIHKAQGRERSGRRLMGLTLKDSPWAAGMGIVGVLSLVGGIMAMTMFKGPDWMMIELPLYLVVAWAAGRMVEGRRARLAG